METHRVLLLLPAVHHPQETLPQPQMDVLHVTGVLVVCAAVAFLGGLAVVLVVRGHRLPRPAFRQRSRLEAGETWPCAAGHEHRREAGARACDRRNR